MRMFFGWRDGGRKGEGDGGKNSKEDLVQIRKRLL